MIFEFGSILIVRNLLYIKLFFFESDCFNKSFGRLLLNMIFIEVEKLYVARWFRIFLTIEISIVLE